MPFKRKVRQWFHENVQTRNVAIRLNELSATGFSVFSVIPSIQNGGVHEVLFYIDKDAESLEK